MADIERLKQALINADAAGDVAAAKVLAAELRKAVSGPDYRATAQEQSGMQNFLAGAGGAMRGMYLGAKQMAGAADQSEVDEHKRAMEGLYSTASGSAGAFTGAAVPAVATAWLPGANTVTGAALVGAGMGALEPTGEGDSRLGNAATGAMVGGAAQKLAKAVGRLNRPVQTEVSPERQMLIERAEQLGIPLNVAQKTGSRPLNIIDSVLDNMPLTADKQAASKEVARRRFNAAVADTFGSSADRLTPEAIEQARSAVGARFTDLAGRNALNASDDFVDALIDFQRRAASENPADISRIVANKIDDLLSKVGPGDAIDGIAYRKFDSDLGRKIRSTTNGDLKNELKQLQRLVRDAMDNSISPADQAAWREARSQYRDLVRVAPIASKSVEGDVSPKLLWNAINKDGGGKLRQVAEVGKAFVNDIPDSGTAQRSFYQRMVENPLTTVWQGGIGGISLPLQAALNSRAGQRYFTQGLLNLNPELTRLGRAAAVGVPLGLLSYE